MWYQVLQANPNLSSLPSPRIGMQSTWSQVHDAVVQSTGRVLIKLSSFVPAVLALLVAVLIFALLGAGLSWIMRRLLVKLRFDERIGRDNSAGLADWAPSHSPTLLVSRIIFWACVVLGAAIGFSAFDAAYSNTTQVSAFLLPYLTRSVGAIVILLLGNLLARFLARSVLISAVNAKLQYARFLSVGVKWLVLVFTGAMVLDHLQIGGLIVDLGFGILFGGMVLTLALAVGLGSREIVSRSLERTAGDRPSEREGLSAHESSMHEEAAGGLRHF